MAIDLPGARNSERGAQPTPRAIKSGCGCIESFVGLLVGLAVSTRHFIILHADLYSRAEQITAIFAIGLAGAVIGKFVGLGRVRYSNRGSRSRPEKNVYVATDQEPAGEYEYEGAETLQPRNPWPPKPLGASSSEVGAESHQENVSKQKARAVVPSFWMSADDHNGPERKA